MADAYRESEQVVCSICDDEPAVAACACCRADACKRHMSVEQPGWCVHCERAYYTYMHKGSGGIDRAWGAWFLGLIPIAIGTIASPIVGAVALAYCFVGPFALVAASKRARRRKFIAETHAKGTPLLPAPERDSELARELDRYEQKRRNARAITSGE
jgi:hypothetical protein